MSSNLRTQFLASAVMLFFLILTSGAMALYVYSDPGIPAALQFVHAAEAIQDKYAEPLDLDKMATSARNAIFDQLDRYSSYVPARGFEHFEEERHGAYFGIGVTISGYKDGLLVIDVKEGGPADSAGMLAGDIILGADSVLLANHAGDPSLLLRGAEGTKVRVLTYRPADNDTLTLVVTRGAVPLRSVPYAGWTDDGLLYIRLLNFSSGASEEIRWAVDSLLEANDKQAKGLILDFRGNPGGLLYEAYSTAALFFDTSTFLVGTKGRSRWDEQSYYAGGHDITKGLPMVVLCDRGTASAAEIVSGALQKAKRAALVGDTTFGKGLVQGFTQYPEGDGLRLTISRYYFADGQFLNKLDSMLHDSGTGLAPDFYFTHTSELVDLLDAHNIPLLFAAKHQDEILSPNRTTQDDSLLIAQLEAFAEKQEFHYESPVARAVNELSLTWQGHNKGEKLPAPLSGLVDAAQLRDRGEYYRQADKLLMQLRGYATNRKKHEHRAYADVIVKEDVTIRYAESILLKGSPSGQ